MVLTSVQLAALLADPGAPNRLRLAMALAGITQVQLAEQLGVSQGYISVIVNGKYGGLNIETARKLAALFGCTIEELFPSRSREEVA